MSKLLSVESLWEHGLCASNFEASWISKTWKKGVGNLSVEDFLDRSQNFARAVGKAQMQKVCRCLTECASNLTYFMRGKINARKLKTRLFGRLNPDDLVSKPRLRDSKRKRKPKRNLESRRGMQKRAKRAAVQQDQAEAAPAAVVTPPVVHQKRPTQTQTRCCSSMGMPPWPLVIVPSGFGYGLSVRLPGAGLLGRAPGYLAGSDGGVEPPKQRPLLPTPCFAGMGRQRSSITAEQLQSGEVKKDTGS